ncbi:MAG: hypothetical protein ACKO66_01670 [Flavobacteriales bacterium]
MKNGEVYRDVIENVNLRFNLNLHDQDLGNMPSRAELALDKINRVALAKCVENGPFATRIKVS